MMDKKAHLSVLSLPAGSVFAFVDKPEGWTSHDCVNYLRRAFKGVKMGHGGTLDPFATGILPIFFNEWTRLSELFTLADKRYQAELTLGTRTDTGDFTGTVVQKSSSHIGAMSYKLLEKSLIGSIKLPIPIYSALKIDGTPMHALARSGQLTESAKYRRTTLYEVRLSQPTGDKIGMDVVCSHGTYIRSLGEYIASKLKTCGHLSSLRRVAYYHQGAPYHIPLAAPDCLIANPEKYIVTLDTLSNYLPCYNLAVTEARNFLTGRWRRAPFKIQGWWLIRIGMNYLGVVFFEKGKMTQRIFISRKSTVLPVKSSLQPMKWSWYD